MSLEPDSSAPAHALPVVDPLYATQDTLGSTALAQTLPIELATPHAAGQGAALPGGATPGSAKAGISASLLDLDHPPPAEVEGYEIKQFAVSNFSRFRAKSPITLFTVDCTLPGFTRGRNLEKTGHHAADTSELFLEGAARGDVGNGAVVVQHIAGWAGEGGEGLFVDRDTGVCLAREVGKVPIHVKEDVQQLLHSYVAEQDAADAVELAAKQKAARDARYAARKARK